MKSLPFGGRFLPAIGQGLEDFGYGLATEGIGNAFGAATRRGAQQQPYRDADQLRRRTEREKAAQQNATLNWLQQMSQKDPRFAQLAMAVESGGMDIGSAWQTGLQLANERPAAPRTGEINGRLVNMDTGALIADFSDSPADNLPPDYMPDPSTPGGVVPRPGSSEAYKREQDAAAAAAEQRTVQQAQQAAAQDAAASLKSATDAITRAQKLVGPMTAGNVMGSEFGQSIPFLGQGAADLAAEIETIESFIGLDKLMAMKAASPTGASGLGQVTEKEMRLLVAQVASLRQTQDPMTLAAKLRYIKDRLDEWGVTTPGAGQQGVPSGTAGPANIPFTIEP